LAVDETYGEITFKTRKGVCRFDPVLEDWKTGGSFPFPPSDPNYRYPDLLPDFELNFYRQEWGAYLTDSYLRRYPLTAHLDDQWENLWIGTAGLGAGRASLRTGRLRMLKFGLMEKNVTAMAFDGEHIWLGGVNMWDGPAGITYVDRDLQSWNYFEARYVDGLRSDDITAFAAEGRKVWVGTLYGLSIYNTEVETWRTITSMDGLADDWVTDVAVDDGMVWVGTSFGASMIDSRGDSVVVTEVPAIGRQRVYDIEADAEFIWFGAEHGVYARDKSQDLWVKFTSPDGTIDGTVTAISSFEKEIWFGTPLGLTVYERSRDRWRWFSNRHQLAAGNVLCIEAGEKAVWVGSDSGLWKFTRRTGLWRVFTTQDGLLADMVQAILLDGAHIWLGTPQGATRFYWDDPMRVD
jgi:ligand-binding sensor domain-containing protein